MEGFTLIDGIVAAVVVLSGILAYSRGLVREAMAIVGWVAATVLAYVFAPQAEPLIKQVPVVGEFIGDNCEISIIVSFAAVLALALVIVSLFTPLFSSLVQRSALGGLDRGFGLIFGVARGLLLVGVAFFVYETVVTTDEIPMVEDSRSAAIFAEFSDKIAENSPDEALKWLTDKYDDLVGGCSAPEE